MASGDAARSAELARQGGEPGSEPEIDAVLRLARANLRLFHRIRRAAREVHDNDTPTAAGRRVLRELHETGPMTVPQMARTRAVSRQHIQTLVNDLLDEELVETRPNPAHKRSHLIAVTETGRELVERMDAREEAVLRRLDLGIDVERLHDATEVLERLRQVLAGGEWDSALHDAGLAPPEESG